MTRTDGDVDWSFLAADDAERVAFASFAAVLAATEPTPVAPPNRLRQVHRVRAPDGRTYYLKRFRKVQWKNLWRNVRTAPRAIADGEREARVAIALRSAGFAAPRPVAVGRRGRRSALLLAELPGAALRERLAAGSCPAALVRATAEHCGRLLAAGFVLPDLSADHVFVDEPAAGTWRLGVLDLHDGRLGTWRARDLRRILRRFQRSVRGLSIDRRIALQFAVRLTRTAGIPRPALRTTLEALAPWDTHARYGVGDRAGRYAVRNPRRAAREHALLERVWPGRPGDRILDVPCGAGRLQPFAAARGGTWHGGDRAPAMLAEARASLGTTVPLVQCDAAVLPFGDGAFDGVVTFRFLHHVPPGIARRVVAESCRVAARFVVVSFFHPISVHNLDRRLREWATGRARGRFAFPVRAIDAWMREAGFARTALAAEAPFLRDLWVAAYERVSPSGSGSRAPTTC